MDTGRAVDVGEELVFEVEVLVLELEVLLVELVDVVVFVEELAFTVEEEVLVLLVAIARLRRCLSKGSGGCALP